MLTTQNPVSKEFKRLKDLADLDLDYSDLQEELQDFTTLAASISGTEISLINFIDYYTQWTVSHHGFLLTQMPREESVCNYTIGKNEPLEILRLDEDPRFREKNYVSGNGGMDLQYYMGIPLKMNSGENIGALCVLDKNEKQLSSEKVNQLNLVARGIVKHLELKRELKDMNRKVMESGQIKDKLAHDIRGPINGINGIADMAIEENFNLIEARSYFRMIGKSSSSLIDLTNDILKIRDKRVVQLNNRIKIEDLSEKIKDLYQPQAEVKDISITVNLDHSKNNEVVKDNLLQIIGNIISNAIKFTPIKGKISLELSKQFSEGVQVLKILVEDSGIGFSSEKIAAILDGKGISSLGSAGEIGFGLGLKVVKQMVQEVGGNFQIMSEENAGTKFQIFIPQP